MSGSKSGCLRCCGCGAYTVSSYQNAPEEEGIPSVKIIEHRGTVVPELDNRKGRRKDAVRSQLTQQLCPEARAGLEEQLAASVGMSGPRK